MMAQSLLTYHKPSNLWLLVSGPISNIRTFGALMFSSVWISSRGHVGPLLATNVLRGPCRPRLLLVLISCKNPFMACLCTCNGVMTIPPKPTTCAKGNLQRNTLHSSALGRSDGRPKRPTIMTICVVHIVPLILPLGCSVFKTPFG